MPELPEVEHVKRGLEPYVVGERIVSVQFSEQVKKSHAGGKQAIVKGADLADFSEYVKNYKISRINRRSKYLLFHMENETTEGILLSHLGMSGAWFAIDSVEQITEEKFRNHVHVIFTFESGRLLIYSDIRRFGEMRFLEKLEDHPPIIAIGPEPFDENAQELFLASLNLRKFHSKPVKDVIMNHQVIAGCGNIYATEALFKSKIHPNRTVSRVGLGKRIELFHNIVSVLQEGIDAGGSSISDYRNVNGQAGSMQDRLQMYGKKECPLCGANVKQAVIGGRNSHYCGKCQR
ncbi:bifunctional DNA-formamidopyrimidine glycosylase/DNA-(apurinic or apyrimidinic site) lyase [Jeotgalibacillus sp. ET6]|uniref:bifunctional DNA-formamidopyrimidine glycosylase/DNA-(apurinic or apyrimidinic site) lyase n=1 Tax=Jeotgalibacillus sp. ET6 TaxID=3037260 RepID=UPI0024183D2A|nr:bifunctional DNA-formamidopyrimidine glycosylase/DNA-(apurinic or apyrimidinic site) lyase [Jeotgalibacillus sp. ET6]MDG5471036.1 bifunctional DNA-formamidopyrimidine glycosylase/DNA-(apurinic or apyrimidinic site) lyase [Jeotgalibacillus sp. ET6]